jgi:small redox-active disulfide protein 2
MAAEDVIQIRIGNFQVGMVGLKEIMADLASSFSGASDEEMAGVLIEHLAKMNYIPEKAKAEYGRALVREFKKYLGQEVSGEEENHGLVIKVLGQGCANCQALSQRIMEVLAELKLAADFEHVTDIKEIARYGILQSPALLINNKIVAKGSVPSKAQLIDWIKKAER